MKQAREYGYGDHGFSFIRLISLLVYFVWTSTYLETLSKIRDNMVLKRQKMIL